MGSIAYVAVSHDSEGRWERAHRALSKNVQLCMRDCTCELRGGRGGAGPFSFGTVRAEAIGRTSCSPRASWHNLAPWLRVDCRVWAADVRGFADGCGHGGLGLVRKYSEIACACPTLALRFVAHRGVLCDFAGSVKLPAGKALGVASRALGV